MKVVVYGGGSFGTAIAHQLTGNASNEITLLLRNKEVAAEINENNINSAYFPNRRLSQKIRATPDLKVLEAADVILLAIPTSSILDAIEKLKVHLRPETLLVNMAKGIYNDGQTLVELLKEKLENHNTVSLKGASFGSEMIDSSATLLTLGFNQREQLEIVKKMTQHTNIFIDYTTDIRGVELLSALKNIYAILIGNIDAKFNSANTRFLFLTKAISEIKIILKNLGAREDTIFLSCGLGDICLTSLNDLSRNRTLGLLIGKGFYNPLYKENSVVLEGVKTLTLINETLPQKLKERLPLLNKMISFFIERKETSLNFEFSSLLQNNYKTVLTYGTFDLLHFGHLEILRRAKELGDRLVVGLSTDEFNKEKGKVCEFPYEKRKQFLESLEYVDLVIPENNWEQKKTDVIEHEVDTFIMGSDWIGKFDHLKEFCEVIYLPRTKGISTTALKAIIKE